MAASVSGAVEPGGNDPSSPTILVVEDEEALRRLVVRMLSRLEYETIEASDGLVGLSLAKEHADVVSLVLSDVVMPGLSGPDMVAELREAGYETPVAFMSGYSGAELGGTTSHTHFLPKPFTMTELGSFVAGILEETQPPRHPPPLAEPNP